MKRSIVRDELPFAAADVLERMGELVSVSRKQRLWTQSDLAAKAEVGLNTVNSIEKGAPNVAFGHWLKVLWAVDQADRLSRFAAPEQDTAGVQLMLQQLPQRVRVSRRVR